MSFTPDSLTFSKLRKNLIPVNIPLFNQHGVFRVSDTTTFSEFRNVIFDSFGIDANSSDNNNNNSKNIDANVYSFRIVYGDSPGQRKFFYDPCYCDNVLDILTDQLAQGYATGRIYVYLIDLCGEYVFSQDKKGKNRNIAHTTSAGGISSSSMSLLSSGSNGSNGAHITTHFGRGAMEWIPYGAVGNTSFIDLNAVTINPASVATTVYNNNDSLYYNPYLNNIFVPLGTSITNGSGGSGNELTTIATPAICPSVEQEFVNEVYNKSIKHGKLWKYQQSKETWREVICLLDQQRLWFHTSLIDNDGTDSVLSTATRGGKSSSTSSGALSGASVAGNIAAANALQKTPVSFIDLDVQTDAVLLGDYGSSASSSAGSGSGAGKAGISSTFGLGRFFSGGSAGTGAATSPGDSDYGIASAGGTSSGSGSGSGSVSGSPVRSDSNNVTNSAAAAAAVAVPTSFHVTYNQNRQVMKFKAASAAVAQEWIDAITQRDSLVMSPLLPPAAIAGGGSAPVPVPMSSSESFTNSGTSDNTAGEPRNCFQSQAQALSGLAAHTNDNAEIIMAEKFISRSESMHNFRIDFSLLRYLSTFQGMLSYSYMREAWEEYLVFSTAGKRKINAYLFRFWCYAEDYFCGHCNTTKPYHRTAARASSNSSSSISSNADNNGQTKIENTVSSSALSVNNSALEESMTSEDPVETTRAWAEGIYKCFIASDGAQCILAETPDYAPLTGALRDTIRQTLYHDNDGNTVAGKDVDVLPGADLFRDLQQIVFEILVNDVYTGFVAQKDYKPKVLMPAVYAYLREKQGRGVLSTVEDWNLNQTEMLNPKSDGNEQRDRTTTVGNMYNNTASNNTTPIRRDSGTPGSMIRRDSGISGSSVNASGRKGSAPGTGTGTVVGGTGSDGSVSSNNINNATTAHTVPAPAPTLAGSRRLHRWFLADSATSASSLASNPSNPAVDLQAKNQRRASKVGPIESANNRQRPLATLIAQHHRSLPVDVCTDVMDNDSGSCTSSEQQLLTPWRAGYTSYICLPCSNPAVHQQNCAKAKSSSGGRNAAAAAATDALFAFGFLPSLWFAFLNCEEVGAAVNDVRRGKRKDNSSNGNSSNDKIKCQEQTTCSSTSIIPSAISIPVVIEKLAVRCEGIEELLRSGKISAASRLLAVSSENPLVLMLHTTIPSASSSRSYLRNNVICPHINQYCRRYHRRGYRLTRDLAYFVDHVLHLIPYYRRLKGTMKPLGVLKGSAAGSGSGSGSGSDSTAGQGSQLLQRTPSSSSPLPLDDTAEKEENAGSGEDTGVEAAAGTGADVGTSTDAVAPTTPALVRRTSLTSPAPISSTSVSSSASSADAEQLLHASIAAVLHSNSFNFRLPYHSLPGVVILVTAARCRYTHSNQRYFGKYHTAHTTSSNGVPCESLITINQDTHYGIAYNSFNPTELNFRCVVVLVEFYGRGYLHLYDSTGYICIGIVHLSNLTKIAPTEQLLHCLDLYDYCGLCWSLSFNGCDDDDALTVCRKWLLLLGSYCQAHNYFFKLTAGHGHGHGHGGTTNSREKQLDIHSSSSITGRDTMNRRGSGTNSHSSSNFSPSTQNLQYIHVVYILQEGFISKKGVFNTSFQKRWFVLDSIGKFRYYRVDNGQLKGEILVSDILETNCNAFIAAENQSQAALELEKNSNRNNNGGGIGSLFGSSGSSNNSTTNATSSTSGGGLFSRFRGQQQNIAEISSTSATELDSNGNKTVAVNSKSSKTTASGGVFGSGSTTGGDSDKGFFVKTTNRLYVFQAESAADAANWVITLRKFITTKSV